MTKENILYITLSSKDFKKSDEDVARIQLLRNLAQNQNIDLEIIRVTEVGIKVRRAYPNLVELLKQAQLGTIKRIFLDNFPMLNKTSDHYRVLLRAIEDCGVEVTTTNYLFYEATKTEWNEPIPVIDGDSI